MIPSHEHQSDPALATWWYLARAYNALLHALSSFFEEHGITGAQFGVMRCVDEAGPEGLPLSHLSERLMVSCGNITGVVDRLEQSGYLQRERSQTDRRVVYARLTERGRAFYRRILPEYRARVRELLAPLAPEEQQRLAELCRTLYIAAQREPVGAAAARSKQEL